MRKFNEIIMINQHWFRVFIVNCYLMNQKCWFSYFFSTANLLILRVGPSSPPAIENSVGRITNFRTWGWLVIILLLNYTGVTKKHQKFIFEYWEFSQKSYLNVWCFEKVHICIPKIPYLHTKKFYICILLHILIFWL